MENVLVHAVCDELASKGKIRKMQFLYYCRHRTDNGETGEFENIFIYLCAQMCHKIKLFTRNFSSLPSPIASPF